MNKPVAQPFSYQDTLRFLKGFSGEVVQFLCWLGHRFENESEVTRAEVEAWFAEKFPSEPEERLNAFLSAITQKGQKIRGFGGELLQIKKASSFEEINGERKRLWRTVSYSPSHKSDFDLILEIQEPLAVG